MSLETDIIFFLALYKYVQFFHQDILIKYQSVQCVMCCKLNLCPILYAIRCQLFLTKQNRRRLICELRGLNPFCWRDLQKSLPFLAIDSHPLLQNFLDQPKSAAGSWMAETQIPSIQTQQTWKYFG